MTDETIGRALIGGPLDGQHMRFRRDVSKLLVPNLEGGREHVYLVRSIAGDWEARPFVYVGCDDAAHATAFGPTTPATTPATPTDASRHKTTEDA